MDPDRLSSWLTHSWLIGLVLAIAAFVVIPFAALELAYLTMGFDPPIGPANIWGFFWLVIAAILIVAGAARALTRGDN